MEKENYISQALTWCLEKLFDTMCCTAAGEKCSCAQRNVPKLLLALVKTECISGSEQSEYLVTSVADSFQVFQPKREQMLKPQARSILLDNWK